MGAHADDPTEKHDRLLAEKCGEFQLQSLNH